jgi:RimJ/RimL family protein N-acetyltransferase
MGTVRQSFMLSGHGLVLREWTDEDLAAMVQLFDDPDVAFRTPIPSPFDPAAAHHYLHQARLAHAAGQRLQLAITTDARQVKGEVRLNRSTGGISHAVAAAYRGQGLARRAVQLMTEHAHQTVGLQRVVLEIEPDNGPSIAVAQAAGFRLTETTPDLVEDKGRRYILRTWTHEVPASDLAS